MSQKIRILGPLPPPYGGVSVYVRRLSEFLKGSGSRIWSYPYKEGADSDIRFFRHRRLGIVPLLLGDGWGARVIDCSHFHLEYPHPILLPIWLVLKTILRVEWIKMILDGSLPNRFREFNGLQRILFRLSVASVSEFVVVHDDLRQWIEHEIKPKQKITTIACLLPLSDNVRQQELAADLRQRLTNHMARPKRVYSAGVFIPDYGFDQVAQAIEQLRAENNLDIGLLLVDGTFARNERYRKEVLRGRDWITVLENVPNEQVYPILKESHVFARAFGEESYGISRVEAIWCGIPVVATNVGETRGMLTYEFGDIAQLKSQLKRALFEPPIEDVQGYAALYRAEAERNLEAIKKVLRLDATS